MAKADDLAAELAADLEHDLAAEYPPAQPARRAPAATPAEPTSAAHEQPAVEAALFLPLRQWQRPRVTRSGASVSVGAGPLRLRFGRPSR